MNAIKLCFLALLLAGCSKESADRVMDPGPPPVFEPSGTWTYSAVPVTYNPGRCGYPANPTNGMAGTASVVRSSSSLTMLANGILYVGTWDGSEMALGTLYQAGPYTIEEVMGIIMSDNNNAAGMFFWTFMDGLGTACSGANRLTIKRI